MISFDTLKLAQKLSAAGFSQEQAEGAAEALSQSLQDTMVTQNYLDVRLSETKADILKWMFTALAAQAGIITALVKLL